MNTIKKHAYILGLITLIFISCKQDNTPTPTQYFSIQGETMGTYYSIKYSDQKARNLKPAIDSILVTINQSLSTYIPNSYISLLNSNSRQKITMLSDQHFNTNYNAALEVHNQTTGLYDPTIGAMTNYYGFGKDKRVLRENISEHTLDSLKTLVGLTKLQLEIINDSCYFTKSNPNLQVDFSSIAKGYAVDELSNYLLTMGCQNHLVDIGGDGFAKGVNPSENDWSIGINKPLENGALNDFALVMSVSNKGLATSGNYRNFYTAGNQKYAHTINPKSGLPEISTLLSASVIADNCMLADAYATACMVMGLEKSQSLISKMDGIEACWIHDEDQDGKLEMTMSDGFHRWVK